VEAQALFFVKLVIEVVFIFIIGHIGRSRGFTDHLAV
jgi:hypothetical protein